MAKKAKKKIKVFAEFKAFITRGNILDMAVGVIIGGAFSAIVTAFVNILMSVCTWGIPGGISSLVTVLPPALGNASQSIVLNGYNNNNPIQYFSAAKLEEITLAMQSVGAELDIGQFKLYGDLYVYHGAAIINWGALINAIISFLIIAITLFVIVKISASITNAKKAFEEKVKEEYYQKHPEERPVPPEPGKPAPTTNELLEAILKEIKTQKAE